VEEERVKSAFEIAMERISALPKLTPEEIAAQKEKQFRPAGEAMAGRYLSGLISIEELAAEMSKYRDEPKQIVQRALISSLCSAIQIDGDPGTATRALDGISLVKPEERALLEKADQDFHSSRHEYEREINEKLEKFGAAAITAMRALGIKGSAVRANLNENPDWQRELIKIRQKYESKLTSLIESMKHAIL
jgi:hypothetical protein